MKNILNMLTLKWLTNQSALLSDEWSLSLWWGNYKMRIVEHISVALETIFSGSNYGLNKWYLWFFDVMTKWQ